MAILIRPGGDIELVEPKNGSDFSLEELYKLIGCTTVECVSLGKGKSMWIDENGKDSEKPVNKPATAIFRSKTGVTDDVIIGNALVCDPGEVI